MTNKIYKETDEQFVSLIKESHNISEVLFKLGYSVEGNSWGFSQVRRRMDELHLSSSDFKGKSVLKTNVKQIDPQKLLKENSKHQRTVLRRYVLTNNLIPYQCAICGISEWNNKTLSLELDHINGINNDNRLENLRFLCPNCHSQTTTYGSRIRKCVVTKIVNESGQKHSNQKYVIRYDANHNELKRYGSLVETAKDLIANNEVTTKRIKTCTRTIMRNKDNLWLNSYWVVLDGCGIINNPQLESSLNISENNVDEAQAKCSVTD